MRWVLSLLVLGVVGILLGSGTFAYFSDTEESRGNYIAAGTLDLEFSEDGNNWFSYTSGYPVLQATDVKPGDSVSGTLYVRNNGTIDGDLYLNISITQCNDNDVTEPEGSNNNQCEIKDKIWVNVTKLDGNWINKTLAQWDNGGYESLGDLSGGDQGTIDYEINLPASVGNEIQDDRVDFNIEFLLLQDGAPQPSS